MRDPRTLQPSDVTTEHQRTKRTVVVEYPPAPESKAVRRRHLHCFSCRSLATTGCVRNGHLIGEPEDVLPPLILKGPS